MKILLNMAMVTNKTQRMVVSSQNVICVIQFKLTTPLINMYSEDIFSFIYKDI